MPNQSSPGLIFLSSEEYIALLLLTQAETSSLCRALLLLWSCY